MMKKVHQVNNQKALLIKVSFRDIGGEINVG